MDIANLIEMILKGFMVYTLIYVLTMLKKKIDNREKVKKMNMELK